MKKGFNPAYAKQPKQNSENANNKSKKSTNCNYHL